MPFLVAALIFTVRCQYIRQQSTH